jgi:hypothetical protein
MSRELNAIDGDPELNEWAARMSLLFGGVCASSDVGFVSLGLPVYCHDLEMACSIFVTNRRDSCSLAQVLHSKSVSTKLLSSTNSERFESINYARGCFSLCEDASQNAVLCER